MITIPIYLTILLVILIASLIPQTANAQSTSSGDVLPGRGITIVNHQAVIDSGIVMLAQRAQDSIVAIKATIAKKLDTTAFTKAAMIGLGMMAYSDTGAALTPYLRKTDTVSLSNRINLKGAGTVTSIGLTSTDFTISGTPVTSSGNITANLNTSGVSAGTYNASYTVNTKGVVTAATNASFNTTPARVLSTTGSNNTFTISSTKNARCQYTVNFAYALTLATSNGYVELDYSTDGGSTWVICGSVSSVYSLSVTLTGNQDQMLVGEIPANALVRIYRINATNSTVTLPTTKQLEITY